MTRAVSFTAPERLNGFPVIHSEPRGSDSLFVIVDRGAGEPCGLRYVRATWNPNCGDSWTWGHYFPTLPEALESIAEAKGERDGERRARSLSAAAVEWKTPTRPITGTARHAVWCGTTPPEQIRAAAYAFHRQAGLPASVALERTRADVEAGRVRFPAFYHNGAGATFSAYGESRLRWIEDPEEWGLRLVGLAHEIPAGNHLRAPVDHKGWYLDPDGWSGETVAGVVYRLPGKDGRARYLAGYADPWNCDSDGRGPACLSLDVIHGEPLDSSWDHDSALRDAARAADAIAERMAEESRDYAEAREAGARARTLAGEALETGRALVAACRDARALWRARGGSPALPGPMVRAALREALERVRALREEYAERLEEARDAREDGRGVDGFRDGYADGEPV